MKLSWLLMLSGAVLLVLLLVRARNLFGNGQWRPWMGRVFVFSALLFVWQSIWYEWDFEWILTLGLLLVVLVALVTRLNRGRMNQSQRADAANIASYTPWILGVLLLRASIGELYQIPSGSMYPTLRVGDFLLVNKLAYGLRLPLVDSVLEWDSPQRGEVVVFDQPGTNRKFIKRIIGLPGDNLSLSRQRLYINGDEVPLRELESDATGGVILMEQLPGYTHRIRVRSEHGLPLEQTHIPAGHYLLLGDNRDNSSDSRVWGLVPRDNLIGPASLVFLYWPGWGSLPDLTEARVIRSEE